MTDSTLSNSNKPEKSGDDNYRSPYEALCIKLRQMKSIADITVKSKKVKEQELFDVLCSLTDMLADASTLCDNLTPQDVPSYKKTRIV